jgi:hypothetical protein
MTAEGTTVLVGDPPVHHSGRVLERSTLRGAWWCSVAQVVGGDVGVGAAVIERLEGEGVALGGVTGVGQGRHQTPLESRCSKRRRWSVRPRSSAGGIGTPGVAELGVITGVYR